MTSDQHSLPEAEVIVEVPFYDIDAMGVAWHGHYIKYCELARSALLESFSYSYREMKESGFAWPVVEVKLRYARPARLGQKIKVRARLSEFELRLKIDFLITDAATGERLSKGHTVQVPVSLQTQEIVFGAPPVLYEKLRIQK